MSKRIGKKLMIATSSYSKRVSGVNWEQHIAYAALSGIAATTFAGSAIAQSSNPSNAHRTFSEWCEEKNTLSVPARQTVEAVMAVADTNDCIEAETRLTNLSELNLDQSQLSDLRPLTALPQLTILKLSGNNISDISPLAQLNNLTHLNLSHNRLSDLLPIAELDRLIYLDLAGNQISNIAPLSSLTGLNDLNLLSNRVRDLSPLAPLQDLVWLELSANRITDISTVESFS